MNTRIILIDDHAIVLDGIDAILAREPGYEVLAKLADGNMALSYLKTDRVDLVITDYSMPDMDGLTLVRRMKSYAPGLKIIMLSMHDEAEIVRGVISAGLDGYILKKYAQKELMQAIAVVMSGGQYWSREVSNALLHSSRQERSDELTDREIEVLRLIVDQRNSREIAAMLFISERTVETHRKNLLRKTGVTNSVGLVRYAYEKKLV